MITIEEFYTTATVDSSFNEIFYKNNYPETIDFYQPHCLNNNIDDRHRLFYHYTFYGQINNYTKNVNEFLQTRIPNLNISALQLQDIWQVHKDFIQIYNETTLSGKKIAQNSKIAVVGLARDCEKNLQQSIDHLLQLINKQLKIFIYENDSIDNTKNLLQLNQKTNNINISLHNHHILKLTGLERQRTNNLAHYRNICLDWVKTNCQDFDYVIVIDLDADLGFSIDGIYNSIGWLKNINDAGGMGSYSLYLQASNHQVQYCHYDSFAVRLNHWQPTAENFDDNNAWFRNLHPLVGSNPIPLYSCFGGLAVYKTKAFLSGRYDGSIGSEHVLFHKSLQKNGYNMYLNPSIRFFAVFNIDNSSLLL